MIKKNSIFVISIFILLILTLSGCLDFIVLDDGSITYESHATKVSYNMNYGYHINCSGLGVWEIKYYCDLPELILGDLSHSLIFDSNYSELTIADNEIISWIINGSDDCNHRLGISAIVFEAESYLIPDISGNEALDLQEIRIVYPTIFNQYTKMQTVDDVNYIDPYDPNIVSIAQNVFNNAKSNNSLIIAKELFIWLKENTDYETHRSDSSVQTASTTCGLKTGDCDDLSYLYISLCRSIGIPARFIRGILAEEENGVVAVVGHAWVEVFVGGNIGNNGWIPIECACPSKNMDIQVNQNFGLETAGHLRLFVDDGSNESMNASISGPRVYYDTNLDVDMTQFIEVEDYAILESKELFIDKDGLRSYK